MKTVALALVAMLTLPMTAYAASPVGPDSYYLEDLTWPEVRARMQAGTDTVIIPSGGTEQNGPAIAIGKHNWIVRVTSGEIARTLGNALAAPVIAYVPEGQITPPQGHMRFPGTISLRDEGYAILLEDAARSFKQHGFAYICFIGDHGGSQQVQQQVADKLNKEWRGQGATVIDVGDYYIDKGADDWVKARKLPIKDASAHAGFMDAAEVMAVDPQGVRPALFKPYTKNDFPKNGAMGDESLATAAYGKTLLQFKVDAAVTQIRKAEGLAAK